MTEDGEGFSRSGIPYLENWLTFPEVGRKLGVTKQMVHKLVFVSEVFDLMRDVRRVGEKPIYVVREEAVLSYIKEKNTQES